MSLEHPAIAPSLYQRSLSMPFLNKNFYKPAAAWLTYCSRAAAGAHSHMQNGPAKKPSEFPPVSQQQVSKIHFGSTNIPLPPASASCTAHMMLLCETANHTSHRTLAPACLRLFFFRRFAAGGNQVVKRRLSISFMGRRFRQRIRPGTEDALSARRLIILSNSSVFNAFSFIRLVYNICWQMKSDWVIIILYWHM